MRPHLSIVAAIVVLAAVGAALAGSAPANDPPPASEAAPAGAMRAYLDPVTGELLPDAPQGVAQPSLRSTDLMPDDSKLEFLEAPDGTHGVFFHGQRQATVTATLEADGSVTTHCVESTATLPDGSAPVANSNE